MISTIAIIADSVLNFLWRLSGQHSYPKYFSNGVALYYTRILGCREEGTFGAEPPVCIV